MKILRFLDDFRNPELPLNKWREKIDSLIERYGEDAVLYSKTGINNSVVLIIEEEQEN